MADPEPSSWRLLFRQYLASARVSVFDQLLQDELKSSIRFDSKILTSNVDTAARLLEWCTGNEFGDSESPTIVIAQDLTETSTLDSNNTILQSSARIRPLEELSDEHFTHAILHVHTDQDCSGMLQLLEQVHRLLAVNGLLVVWRRSRDGLAEVLHAAGLGLPGRIQDQSATALEKEGLASLATQAGFAERAMHSPQKSFTMARKNSEPLLDDLRAALSADECLRAEIPDWRARFDRAVDREMSQHTGILLFADVLMANKRMELDPSYHQCRVQ